MKTVKKVSELTGISIRTLRYYDEIDLLKPAKVTEVCKSTRGELQKYVQGRESKSLVVGSSQRLFESF